MDEYPNILHINMDEYYATHHTNMDESLPPEA